MSTLQIMPQSTDDCKNKHVYNFVAHKLNHFTILKNLFHIFFPYHEKSWSRQRRNYILLSIHWQEVDVVKGNYCRNMIE